MVKVAKKSKKNKSSKLSRKELKQQDKFVEATTKGAERLGEYTREIAIAAVAIVIIMGAVYAFQSQRTSRAGAVTGELGKALKIYEATIDKKAKSTDDKKVFKTEKAKYTASIKAFEKLLKSHGSTHAGALIRLYLGHCYLRLNQPKKAREYYLDFLKRVSNKDPLRYLGVEALAQVQHLLKKPQVGVDKLKEYKEKGSKQLRPFALMRLAEYHQSKKDYKMARVYYKQMTKLKETSSSLKTTAQRRLAVLP